MKNIKRILKRSLAVILTAAMLTGQAGVSAVAAEVSESIESSDEALSASKETPEQEETKEEKEESLPTEETDEEKSGEESDKESVKEESSDSDGENPPDKEEKSSVSEDKAESPAFNESKEVDGVKITVFAEEGVFPGDNGLKLSVKKANYIKKQQAKEAVEEERSDNENVAASYTYDIKVLDDDGNELQPADESKVKVSFTLDEVSDENLKTNIYHITEENASPSSDTQAEKENSLPLEGKGDREAVDEVLYAEKLEVTTDGTTVTAETDGFSLYTVEFTYENKQYVMPGDSEIPLSTILDTVGLAGEVTDVRVSDEDLFSVSDETGEWIVTAHKAFSTTEWMKVRINGVDYEITVTDDQGDYNISGGSITINSSNKDTWNDRVITGTINKANCEANETSFFNKHGSLISSRAAIIIDGTDVNLTIRDLNITATRPDGGYAIMVSPILLKKGAKLNLTIEGTNTLTACWGGAGICVPGGCTLNISGNGTLNATGGNDGGNSIDDYSTGGAGIGMCQYLKESELGNTLGNITISGGTITAQGGSQYYDTFGAAGIGGSEGTTGGVIKITGGNVTAKGGSLAAGIGGGGSGTVDSITISGGTVKATGGKVQGGSDAHFVGGTFIEVGGSSLGSTAIGCGYEGSQDHGVGLPAISITGGSVTAEGNIGCPDVGYYRDMGSLTVSDPNQVSCTGRITCPGYANPEFTVTLYGTGISEGTGECGFRIGNESTYKPCNYSVTSDGAGKKLTVRTTRIIKDAESVDTLVAHIKIGDKIYDTASATLSKDKKEQALYSGYLCTLSGAVYDTGMPNVATGTVEIEGVTPEASSVSVSGSKATVSATFSFPEDGSLTDEGSLTKKVTVKIGNKVYQLDDVTFERSAAHKKKAEFSHNANGYSYIDEKGVEQYKKDNEVTVLDGSQKALTEGWYAVPAGQTIELKGESVKVISGSTEYNSNYPVNINGDVHIILCDGSTADAKCGINVTEGNSLTIYGQSKGTGKLTASDHPYNTFYGYTAIGSGLRSKTSDPCSPTGNITICGGVIEATVKESEPAIGGGYYGIGGTLTITGGKVTAASQRGKNAVGGYYYDSNKNYEGAVILSWNDPDTELYTSAFQTESKTTVNFQKTFVLKDSPETVATRANMGGKTIVPGVKITFDKGELSGSMADTYGRAGGSFTLPECSFTVPDGSNSKFAGWKVGNDDKVLPAGTPITLPGNTDSLTLTAVSKPLYIIEGYTAEGAKIKATGTGDNGSFVKAITIVKPSHEIYGDGKSAEATISGDTDVLGTPTISYYKGTTKLSAAPTAVGTYSAKITLGEGVGAATASVEYTIARKPVTITGVTASNKEYDGTTKATPVITSALIDGKVGNDNVNIVVGTAEFSDANEGKDKTVTFSGFSLGGDAAANYELTAQPADTTANIEPKSITGATVTLNEYQFEYDGSEKSVSVTGVTLNGKALIAGTDYEVTNGTTGTVKDTYTVTVTGKGNYKGTAEAEWNITPKEMTAAAPDVTVTYDGESHGIIVNVSEPASGYTIRYGNQTDTCTMDNSPTITSVSDSPKTVYFEISADNYKTFKGSAKITINPKTVNSPDITVTGAPFTYSGSAFEPAVTVKDGETVIDSSEYSVNYANNTNAGTATINITDRTDGNYNVSGSTTFRIGKKSIIPAVSITGSYSYDNGRPVIPSVTVTDGATALASTDYTAAVSNNINAGTGKVIVKETPDGNYTFSQKEESFTISPVNHDTVSITADITAGATRSIDLSRYIEAGGRLDNVSFAAGEFTTEAHKEGSRLYYTASESCTAGETQDITARVVDAVNYNDYDITVTVTVVEKQSQTLSFAKKEVTIKTGETFTNNPEGAETPVSYKSSNEKVATVDAKGKVTAVAEGKATITAAASETDEYYSAEAAYTVNVEGVTEEKVPLTKPDEKYAAPEDNFAPVASSGKANDLSLDFSKVADSNVKPSELKMTVVNGSKLHTEAKLKSANSIKATGDVKIKVDKNTLIPTITCKGSGSVTMTMADGSTYTVTFTAEKPKAQKAAKNMSTGGKPVEKTVTDLFGTHINAGELTIVKQKHSQAKIQDNALIIDPKTKDSIRIQYKYLNRKYKMTIKVQ